AAKNGAPASGNAAGPGEAVDVLHTRDDAFRHLLKIAAFFQRTEPQSIVPHALEQVVRWGRTPLPELLVELIGNEASRKEFFKQVGIKTPEPTKGDQKK